MKIIQFITDSYEEVYHHENGNITVSFISTLGLIVTILLLIAGFVTMSINEATFRIWIVALLASSFAPIWYYNKLKNKEKDN